MSDLLHRARAVAAVQDGLIRAHQVVALGINPVDVRRWCRQGLWFRVQPTVYLVDAFMYDVEALPARTVIRAAAYASPPETVVVGTSAAVFHEVQGTPLWSGHVELASTTSTDGPAGDVEVHQWAIDPSDVVLDHGMRLSAIPRTLIDLVLSLDRGGALSVLDSALHQELISVDGLAEVERKGAGRPGIVAARPLFRVADGRAASPLESRVRLDCIDGGVPPDDLQWAVRDRDGFIIGYGDMAWVRGRRRPLVAEADGVDVHTTPKALLWDRRRANGFVGSGVDTIRFVWADTMARGAIASAVRRALAA